MDDEELYLPITTYNNRNYMSFRNKYGKILPIQLGIYATSGHGKGLAEEGFIERWRKVTKGVVIYLADPKDEAEGTFVMYEPIEMYHLEQLRHDGIKKSSYPCKIYHPFTFNIPKGFLPDINFFSIPIKHLTAEDWGILIETSSESESIKLLKRVSNKLSSKSSLFNFIHLIEKLTEGKAKGRKLERDPDNYYLRVKGGTAKSVTEIAGTLDTFFKNNYFLRKEDCQYKLDWKTILNDNHNYHVFISMWLKDEKLKSFMIHHLLRKIIENKDFLKKPILIVIPEILKLCPRDLEGYKIYLSKAISEALSTIRSKGRGMSFVYDSQNWSYTDDKIKGATQTTLFGQLSTKDVEVVCKALQYKRDVRVKLMNMNKNSYFRYGKEEFDPFRLFFPSHMHKEPEYNWIEMYKRHFESKMKRYDELIKYMRDEFKKEEQEIKDKAKIEKEIEIKELEEKNKKKDEKESVKKSVKTEKEDDDKRLKMKLAYEMFYDNSLPKSERTFRKIGKKLEINHVTAKKYISLYENQLEENKPTPESIKQMVGGGILPEEIESNFTELEGGYGDGYK